MDENFATLWVYLGASPLLWLTVTIAVYAVADALSAKAGRHPLANPVLIAAAILGTALVLAGVPYRDYFEGAQFVHFLLGPATVALGLPLVRRWSEVRRRIVPMLAALVAGSVTAVVSTVAVAALLGAPGEIVASLAPKSVTTPIAMGISELIGGIPSLTAVLVIATGMLGAIAVTPVMNLLGITEPDARGFSAGLAAHGIGTARAFQVNPVAGLFAGIAMAFNGAATAIIVPLLLG